MYCRAIACDYDGTSASDGHLAPEVAAALHAAREAGIVTLLVTGRVLDDLRVALVDFSAFDAVVAENGAVVWLRESDRTIILGAPPSEQFLGRLRAARIPFHAGAVVVGTWDTHVPELIALVRERGADLQLVFNRAAVMLLPSGINKAVGTQRALDELGRSPRNLIAFGDAENDLPLFALAELAVAARGSVPAVAVAADDRLRLPGAAGVADWVRALLARGAKMPTPHRLAVELGSAADGTPAILPLDGQHVLVSGDPRSGKSWVAGLAAECLMDAGYRLCVFDPESDHVAVGHRPGAIVLGREIGLPKADDVGSVISRTGASIVLDLTSVRQAEKCEYVGRALRSIGAEQTRSGLPHWIVVDEAHYFFGAEPTSCADAVVQTGSIILVTYRPSLIAPDILESIGAFLLTRTTVEQERYFVDALLRARGPVGLDVSAALGALEAQHGGLLSREDGVPRWQIFVPRPRLSVQAIRARRYAGTESPPGKEFLFRLPNDGTLASARTVEEFDQALASVPTASLEYHVARGDFSRWARDVLGDADLAAGLAKLETINAVGAPVDREELRHHLHARYVL
jgi:hydroxymethylpyrimidine pyrophosphatase-like HAD family hydrolase